MKQAGIYAIVHFESGRRYVGSSKDICRRFADHRSVLHCGHHPNRYLQAAWNKYGPDAFHFLLVEPIADLEQLHEREQVYLDLARPDVFNVGPVARATFLGVKHTPEAREKQRLAHLGKKRGVLSPEVLANMRRAARHRRPMSPERAAARSAKISAKAKGRPSALTSEQWSAIHKGRPKSAEMRARLSATWKAIWAQRKAEQAA